MPFEYPSSIHQRKHAPAGYTNYQSYKEWLRDEFQFRCVYCLFRERFCAPPGESKFGVDHIHSQAGHPHLACEYDNLVYACNDCNSLKRHHSLANPRATPFSDHLSISPDGESLAKSPEGTRLIKVLKLNSRVRIEFRARFFKYYLICLANPNTETARLFRHFFAYPDSLPNLAALRPPANHKAEAIRDCYFERRRRGELEETY